MSILFMCRDAVSSVGSLVRAGREKRGSEDELLSRVNSSSQI